MFWGTMGVGSPLTLRFVQVNEQVQLVISGVGVPPRLGIGIGHRIIEGNKVMFGQAWEIWVKPCPEGPTCPHAHCLPACLNQ